MSFHKDLRILEELRVISYKVVGPEVIEELTKTRLGNFDDFLSLIHKYEVADYVKTLINASVSCEELYYRLVSNWLDNLRNLSRLMGASKHFIRFINYIHDGLVIRDLIKLFSEYPNISNTHYFIDNELINTVRSDGRVSSVLELGRSKLTKYVYDALLRSKDLLINEINLVDFETDVLSRYWREFITYASKLRPQVGLVKTLRVMRNIDLELINIRSCLIKGCDLRRLTSKYEHVLAKVLLKDLGRDPWLFDASTSLLRNLYPINVLAVTPLSYDTLLLYISKRFFESLVISNVMYLISNNLVDTYIRRYFGELRNVLKNALN